MLEPSFNTSLVPLLAAVPLKPDSIFGFVTNSIIVATIVTVGILLFTRMATKRMELVPNRKQNLVEFVIEFLLGEVEGILGRKIALQVFPLLATIFIFILISNWFGLIPGVGTIGFGHTAADVSAPFVLNPEGHHAPLFRPATADLNMNFAMALVFMVVWLFITIREVGVVGFLKHIFGAKGGMTGIIGMLMA
ncbi:MAG: F0F1 ATP synthase subunit A, partial [Verrucomicrobiae bacterium]|nr:F0F1 ATP synthase subunit A [Verrucomicrobiae bacterium]